MQYGLQLFAVAMILAHGGGVAAGGSGIGGRQTDANRFWRTPDHKPFAPHKQDNRQHEADSFEGCTVPYISQHCVVNSTLDSRRTLIAIADQQTINHPQHHIKKTSHQWCFLATVDNE